MGVSERWLSWRRQWWNWWGGKKKPGRIDASEKCMTFRWGVSRLIRSARVNDNVSSFYFSFFQIVRLRLTTLSLFRYSRVFRNVFVRFSLSLSLFVSSSSYYLFLSLSLFQYENVNFARIFLYEYRRKSLLVGDYTDRIDIIRRNERFVTGNE